MASDNETTPGPWYVVKTGQQFTAIATVPELAGEFDPDHEVLTVSNEWLNVRPADIYLMAKAPELKAEVERLHGVIGGLESLRPHWAQGFSSDGIAAQVTSVALSDVWGLLGVTNQTQAMAALRALIALRDIIKLYVDPFQVRDEHKAILAAVWDSDVEGKN